MYFPDGVWREIKTYLIHNIATQGKHFNFEKNPYISQYNKVVYNLPRLTTTLCGPRIVYDSKRRMVTFLYYIMHKKIKKLIIQRQMLPKDFREHKVLYKKIINDEYVEIMLGKQYKVLHEMKI